MPASASEEMKTLRTLCGEYQEDDIYNMDETGLFWRQTPSSGLATQSRPGIKKDKSRITLVVCVNCTGSDRLPLWMIGNAKVPRSLCGLNIEALGGVWKSNKTSWMNSLVMREWLLHFYSHIGNQRSVLLLMDNFSAHIQGVELLPPPSNIRIQWLPANSTSLYQPLDQGINNTLKLHYRRKWLQYMIQKYEEFLDPISTVTLYHAVHWILQAWNYDITNTAIYNCFRKSSVIQPRLPNLPSEPQPDLSTLYQHAQQSSKAQDFMKLENFLNPADENQLDPNPADMDSIIASYTTIPAPIDEASSDEEEYSLPEPPPSINQTLEALQTVLRYEEYSETSQREDIRMLETLERRLNAQSISQRKQQTLESWLM